MIRSATNLICWLLESFSEYHVLRSQGIFRIPLVASHLPLTMAEIRVPSSLKSAKEKLKQNNFPFEDLPNDRSDPLWVDIKEECGLTTPEVSALKNAIAGTTSKSVHAI